MRHGVLLYDGPVRMRDVTFANFDRPGAAAVSAVMANGVIVSGRFSVERSRFVDARPVLLAEQFRSDGERMARLHDVDGSATGVAGATLVAGDDFLLGDGCEARPEWGAHLCHGGIANVVLTGASGAAPAAVTGDDGRRTRFLGYTPSHLYFPAPTRRAYTIHPDGGPRAEVTIGVEALAPGDWITVAVPVTAAIFRARIDGSGAIATPAPSLEALAASPTTAVHFDAEAGLVHVRFVGVEGRERSEVYVFGN